MKSNKIRVLHVGIGSHLGGIETYLRKIATHVNRDEFQFDFLSYKGSNPCFYEELKALGCNFHFITSRRQSILKNKAELKILLETENYDIVHCHLNSLSYITPCLVALKTHGKVIVHSRNAGCLQSYKSRILHKVNYLRLPKSKITCVAVSDLAGEWMFGRSDFLVLNNGINTDKFRFNVEDRLSIREEFAIDKDEEVILNVGAFRPQKNHNFILKIFSEYLKAHNNSRMLLVGEGDLLNEIKLKAIQLDIQNNIIFAGARNDVYKFYSAADKFLFPSFYEGFPNVLLEAETSGLMCVVSDVITKQAILPDLCTTLSLEDSITCWVEALNNDSVKERERYAEYVKELGFDVATESERLENLYKNLLNN